MVSVSLFAVTVISVGLFVFFPRFSNAQENQCSFLTRISVYKREKGDDSGPFFSASNDGPFEVVNNKGQALKLDQDNNSTYVYTTDGLVFDPKGRFAYKKGEQSGIVLTGFDESKYEIQGVFCEELDGSTGGCPSPDEIQKQGRTDMIEGLRVDCGVRLSYGWIVNPLFEETKETGSLSIRTYSVEGSAPVDGTRSCSIYDLAAAVGRKIPGTQSYSKEVVLNESSITLTHTNGFTKTITVGKGAKSKFDIDSLPVGTYSITTSGVTKELSPMCEPNKTVVIKPNTITETALVYWTNPGFKCETTTTCSACKSQGKECKVKLTDSYLCCPGKKKTAPANPTVGPTVPKDPKPPTESPTSPTPTPQPPSKPSVGTGWCSTKTIGERFDRYVTSQALNVSTETKTKRVAAASCICQRESGGVPTALNDGCIGGTSREYSIGLFQLNVWAQPLHCRFAEGDVNKIFNPKNAQIPPFPKTCQVLNFDQLNTCFERLTGTEQIPNFGDYVQNSYSEMFEKSNGLTNFGPWTTKDDSECNRLIKQL